ncbi:NAD(P)-dependent oxidoreductase [Curtobacterium ammoniigenes]|uniref:NAD(P)-dependent oxidoreductase n=1 Tax=Curtobacterium ammoniigenes TaxID=395387 RepID=UPI00082F9093|nr:NAD(P)-dependent oxidoreductase [Curtobacterium ammoniigenes]
MSTPSVAWLGAGRMGTTMVERLLDQGFEVGVWNRTPDKVRALVERGATQLAEPADARNFDVAWSMILDDRALEALHGPADGLLSQGPGSLLVWVDGSTVSTEAASRAAAAASDAGISYVSAPVSGNPGVVAAGRAIFAVSGPDAGVEAARPVLEALGRATYVVGEQVQANVVKLATNALLAIVMQALAEVAVLGEKAGVSRADLLAFINDSAVGSPFSSYKTKSLVELDFTPTFTTEGQRKDARLALDLAAALESPMPLLSTAEVAFSRTIASGLGAGKDLAAVLLTVARDAGITLEPEM